MEQLIALQVIDTKLKDLEDLLGDLPSKIEGLNQEESSIKNNIKDSKERLKSLDVEINKRELDITQASEKIDTLKDQLFLVTNNKQYDALMMEIDHFKEKKSSFENDTISFLDEKEKLDTSLETMESKLQDLSKDLSQRREKLESAISHSADERLILEQQRKESIEKIDLSIITTYNKVMDARNGLAVVQIEGSGCGGCGAHIPPQKLTELRANSGIHRCDICGRFLYDQKLYVN